MSDVTAIPGTRRQVKELVDGTLVLSVHIDPPFKAALHRLFPEIDMPVAIAPLVIGQHQVMRSGPGGNDEEAVKHAHEPIGPRCKLAVMWCKDPQFQDWMVINHLVGPDPDGAAEGVRNLCGVASRRELDTDADAGAVFDELIRQPYASHLRSLE